MAKKNIFEKKTEGEISTMIIKEEKNLLDLEFSFAGSRPKNVHERKKIKKTIARAMTALAQIKKSS